jgi:hypothetical protein
MEEDGGIDPWLTNITVFGPAPRFGLDKYPPRRHDCIMMSEIYFPAS